MLGNGRIHLRNAFKYWNKFEIHRDNTTNCQLHTVCFRPNVLDALSWSQMFREYANNGLVEGWKPFELSCAGKSFRKKTTSASVAPPITVPRPTEPPRTT